MLVPPHEQSTADGPPVFGAPLSHTPHVRAHSLKLVKGLPEAERGHRAKRRPAAALDELGTPVKSQWERQARLAGGPAQSG